MERTEAAHHGSLTCPTCRRRVEDAAVDEGELCRKCLALHHRDCWEGKCGACGARGTTSALAPPAGESTSAAPALPKPRKTTRTRAPRSVYATLKLAANIAWLATYVVAFVAFFIAFSLGVHFSLFVQDLPLWLRILLYPHFIISFPVLVLNLVDALLRMAHDERPGKAPVILAALGFVTGGLTSFIYFAIWGWKPLDPGA